MNVQGHSRRRLTGVPYTRTTGGVLVCTSPRSLIQYSGKSSTGLPERTSYFRKTKTVHHPLTPYLIIYTPLSSLQTNYSLGDYRHPSPQNSPFRRYQQCLPKTAGPSPSRQYRRCLPRKVLYRSPSVLS